MKNLGNLENIEEILVNKLLKNGKKLSTAESCTGGLTAQRITSVSGASGCFDLGAVTYANEQKERILGVKHETLEKHGAVSRETALEMSSGIKKLSGADIGIGITGLAGPGGGSEKKPVGLVYIGICTENKNEVFEYHFSGDRSEVRQKTSDEALRLALERI